MIWQSIWMMTVIDFAIIAIVAYMLVFFFGMLDQMRLRTTRYGVLAISLGLLVTALYFLLDLVTMHVFPIFMPHSEAMEYTRDFHFQFSWIAGGISSA